MANTLSSVSFAQSESFSYIFIPHTTQHNLQRLSSCPLNISSIIYHIFLFISILLYSFLLHFTLIYFILFYSTLFYSVLFLSNSNDLFNILGQNPLYLPDCDSYLRNSETLLANDDEWLSVRAKYGVRAAGLYLLHPNVSLSVGLSLGVHSISSVLVEKLDLRDIPMDPFRDLMGELGPEDEFSWNPCGTADEKETVRRIISSLRSDEFSSAVHSLSLSLNQAMDNGRKNNTGERGRKNSAGGAGEGGGGGGGGNIVEHSEIELICRCVTLRFVDYLPVKLVLKAVNGPPGRTSLLLI